MIIDEYEETICMSHKGLRMKKDLQMNEEVTVTMPAFVWQGFCAEIMVGRNGAPPFYTRMIARAAQESIIDPVYIKETEAEHQAQQAQGFQFGPFMMGPFTDEDEVPPTPEGLE